MPKGYDVDLDALHNVLWERTDRVGRTRINQSELAQQMGITKFTMSRVMNRMVVDQRIRRITGGRLNTGMFLITDPTEWVSTY